jgi:hypothetical protein
VVGHAGALRVPHGLGAKLQPVPHGYESPGDSRTKMVAHGTAAGIAGDHLEVVRGGRLDIEMGDECRLPAARRPARGDHPRAGRIPAAEGLGPRFSATASVDHSLKLPLQPTCHPIR